MNEFMLIFGLSSWVLSLPFWAFVSGYHEKRFIDRKTDTQPPFFLGAILGFTLPLQILVVGAYYVWHAMENLGADKGLSVNTELSLARAERRAAEKGRDEVYKAIASGEITPGDAESIARYLVSRGELEAARDLDAQRAAQPAEVVGVDDRLDLSK